MTDNSAAEGTTGTTGTTAAGSQGNQPDYEALYKQADTDKKDAEKRAGEFQNRFTGLQGKYQQEQSKWADDVTKISDIQTQLDEVSGIREQLDLQVTGLQEQLDTANTEKEISDSQLDRLQIVTTEFPDLVPFLQDDLIPDDTGEELRTKLTKMNERLGEVAKTTKEEIVKDLSEGATPPPGGSTGEKNTAPDLLDQATKAMVAGEYDKYNELFEQYLEKSRGGS